MFELYSSRARRVVNDGYFIAREFGHAQIGGENLLLSLTEDHDGVAGQILKNLGVEAGALREVLDGKVPAADQPSSVHLAFSAEVVRAMRQATRSAIRGAADEVGTQSLLEALVDDPGGLAVRMLGRVGVSRQMVLDAVDAAKASGARDTPDDGVGETLFVPMVAAAPRIADDSVRTAPMQAADANEPPTGTGSLLLQVSAIRAQLDRVLTRLAAIERRLEHG